MGEEGLVAVSLARSTRGATTLKFVTGPSTGLADSDPAIINVLRAVMDPELGDNIVDLGMVRSAHRAASVAHVTIALTTAGCPLRATIKRDCENRIELLEGIDSVELHWDELNATEKARVMERARKHARDQAAPTQVPAATRVLAVASGKGGVGKSTVTVNLAVDIASRGFLVGVLDADIWGFSVPRMLGLDERLAVSARAQGASSNGTDKPQIVPASLPVGDGRLEVVSTGLIVESEDTALMWRGLMLSKAVEQFLHDVAWGPLDYLLIDMPPGTGDVQMALARLLPQAEMLVVTIPALNAQKVAARVADMAQRSHMTVLGVIENMGAYVTPDGQPVAVFGSGGGAQLAADLAVPLLGSVPLEPAVSVGGDSGQPVALSQEGGAAAAFNEIASKLVDVVAPPIDLTACSAFVSGVHSGPVPVSITTARPS